MFSLFLLLAPISVLLLFLSLAVAVGDCCKVGRFSVICHNIVQLLFTIIGFIQQCICGCPIVHGRLIGFFPALGIRGYWRGPAPACNRHCIRSSPLCCRFLKLLAATILAKCLLTLHPLPRPRGRTSVRDGRTSLGVGLALGVVIFCSFWVLIKFLAFARMCQDSANITAIPTTKAFFPAQIYWPFILSMICCSSSVLNPSFADLQPQKIRHAMGLRTAMSEISLITLSMWSLINSSFHA